MLKIKRLANICTVDRLCVRRCFFCPAHSRDATCYE